VPTAIPWQQVVTRALEARAIGAGDPPLLIGHPVHRGIVQSFALDASIGIWSGLPSPLYTNEQLSVARYVSKLCLV